MKRKIKLAVILSTIMISFTASASGFYNLIAQNQIDSMYKVCTYKNSMTGHVITLKKNNFEMCQQSIYL